MQVKSITAGIVASICLVLMSFSTDESVQPQSGIANNYEQELSISNFPASGEVLITVNEEGLTVTSYRFIIAPPGQGEAYMHAAKGSIIRERDLEKIRNATPGDRILIDQVKAKYSNGLETFCQPAMYNLVE
jgi:hypothetical protein